MKRLTRSLINRLLDYDPNTGVFRWLARSPSMFTDCGQDAKRRCSTWNTRFAGKQAGWINDQGYVILTIFYDYYRAHNVVWFIHTGKWPSFDIDHANLNRSDNRFSNLRRATRSQNMSNRLAPKSNSSGFKGVGWMKCRNKWRARITVNYKEYHLGMFATAEEANRAYIDAATRIYGAFARWS